MITRFMFVCVALCILCSVARGRAALPEEDHKEEILRGAGRRTRLFRRILHRRGVRSDGRRQLWGFVKKATKSVGKAFSSAGKAVASGVSSAAKAVAKTATTVANGAVKAAETVATAPLAGAAALAKVAGAK